MLHKRSGLERVPPRFAPREGQHSRAVGLAFLMVLFLSTAFVHPAVAETATKLDPVLLPPFPLGVVSFPNGKALNLSVSMGAGAFRPPDGPAGRLWTVTNGGPLIHCMDSKTIIGMSEAELCGGNASGFIAPLPGFAPTIYTLDIAPNNTVQIVQSTALKGKSGKPLSGLFARAQADAPDAVYGLEGQLLERDASGVSPNALVRLRDGTIWISDTHGPSLLQVAPDGTVIKRLVIEGSEAGYEGADYEISASLPAVLSQLDPSSGFEAMALSPDEQFIFLILRGPLSGQEMPAGQQTLFRRLFKLDRATLKVVAEFAYQMEAPNAFKNDFERHPREVKDIKIAEIVAMGPTRLLVTERISRSARFFVVDLDKATPLAAVFDSEIAKPVLEAMTSDQFAASGIKSLRKTLLFDADSLNTGAPNTYVKQIEGIARLSERELILISNSSFGVEGDRTKMFRLVFPEAVLK